MHKIDNDEFFKDMTLDQIKKKIATKPKHIPDTVLDTAAMHAAIDRFQAENQAKEIREWLIYEAPAGMYDLYLEEKARLEKQELAHQRHERRVMGIALLGVLAYTIYSFIKMLTL